MNNDLEQFSEERLKDMQKHVTAGMTLGHADALLIRQAIDIALAAKQAKPVAWTSQSNLDAVALEIPNNLEFMSGDKGVYKKTGTALHHPHPAHAENEVTLDYLQGHRDGLEWAARTAEACNQLTSDWLYEEREALVAAIRKGPEMPPAHTEQVIPDGWKLVPIEPTEAMLDEFDSIIDFGADDSVDAWRRLISAAPKPDGTLISEGTKNDSCQWNRDEDSVYSTGCGNEWQFTDGGLEDNQIKFRPYCSGKISAAPKPESE